MQRVEKRGTFFKVDAAAQIAYGWAIVCTENGAPYVDLQGDHIPDDVMLEAAVDFAANSRVGKDMHAGDSVGEHLFVYPITKAAAVGLGLATSKTGLLVGFKPSDPAMLDMIKSGERTGFSIGGVLNEYDDGAAHKSKGGKPGQLRSQLAKATGVVATKARTFRSFRIDEISLVDMPAMEGAKVGYVKNAAGKPTVVLARRFSKQVVLTDEVDGHQHAIDLDDPIGWCGDNLSTTYATSEGADNTHAHVWTFDTQTGAVTIGADSGHTHAVDVTVPAAVLASFNLTEQAEAKENALATLAQVLDGDGGAADVSISIAARAPQSKSTQPAPLPTTKAQPETKPMNFAKMLAAVLAMTSDERSYVGKLGPEDAEAFVTKSATDRDAIVKSARGVEVYKSDRLGRTFYATDDQTMSRWRRTRTSSTASSRRRRLVPRRSSSRSALMSSSRASARASAPAPRS